jgi:hypothetical protein
VTVSQTPDAQIPGIPRAEFLTRLERTRAAAAARGLDGVVVIGRSFYDRVGDLAFFDQPLSFIPRDGVQR